MLSLKIPARMRASMLHLTLAPHHQTSATCGRIDPAPDPRGKCAVNLTYRSLWDLLDEALR